MNRKMLLLLSFYLVLMPVTCNAFSKIYPCQGCPAIRLDKIMPDQVQAGKEFEYKIRVTNLTDAALTDVVVTDTIIKNFQHISSTPPANIQIGKLVWTFSELGPKETREIIGTATTSSGGIVQNFVDTDVTYKTPLRIGIVGVQPNIVITKSAPAQVPACKPIIYIFKIENTGTASAYNVIIIDDLPEGFAAANGGSNIDIPIGTLSPGASSLVSAVVTAQKSGTYTNNAVAIADKNITVESPAVTTIVKKPVLAITNTGPQTQNVSKEITYEIAVTNTGNWPADDTIIDDAVPAGFSFIRAGQGGTLMGNKVMWKIVRLNPGSTVKVSVTYMPNSSGTVVNTASASAVCADVVTSAVQTHFYE